MTGHDTAPDAEHDTAPSPAPDAEHDDDTAPDDDDGELWIEIDGERHDIDRTYDGGHLTMIESGRMDWYIAADAAEAGEAAVTYWRELAEGDPDEFTVLVGRDTLIAWALGRYAGPGSTRVCSLREWLELWRNTPEEQWASYDCHQCQVTAISPALEDEIGFRPTVAYRHN